MKSAQRHLHAGYFILDTLIGFTIFAILIASIIPTISFVFKRSKKSQHDTLASIVLQNGLEASYSALQSMNWSNISYYTPYYPLTNMSNKSWELLLGEQTNLETRFTRHFTFEKVCRVNTTGVLSAFNPNTNSCQNTADQLDVNTIRMIGKISWEEAGTKQKKEVELLLISYFR